MQINEVPKIGTYPDGDYKQSHPQHKYAEVFPGSKSRGAFVYVDGFSRFPIYDPHEYLLVFPLPKLTGIVKERFSRDDLVVEVLTPKHMRNAMTGVEAEGILSENVPAICGRLLKNKAWPRMGDESLYERMFSRHTDLPILGDLNGNPELMPLSFLACNIGYPEDGSGHPLGIQVIDFQLVNKVGTVDFTRYTTYLIGWLQTEDGFLYTR